MRILDRYILSQILLTTLAATGVLTFLVVVPNAFRRVFEHLVNSDIPLLTILQMVLLLVPQALTLTIPWGFLMAILMVMGRMSHDLELQAVRSSGLGLVPLVSPVILLSLGLSLLCLYNNAMLAPRCITAFKLMLVDMGRKNPTMLLRAQEPITAFPGFRIYVDKKYGQTVEGVAIWILDDEGLPKSSVRAERGTISADLNAMVLTLTLFNARQENRGEDPTQLDKIQTGMRAGQFPITVSLKKFLDTSNVTAKISNLTFGQLTNRIFEPGGDKVEQMVPLLTEFQKRLSLSVSCFTFALMAIPLAVYTQRRETSISFALSLGLIIVYYLILNGADALRHKASAYPDVVIWLPNVIFQLTGFCLLWKANRHPM
ncbi:MAG: LptF/LptG family permease [Candidatus Methylacidiphilales bacterium]|nr:LptF/LptG family permease [Candidatus Methylacidiphilales bacterium]